ncbi:hypothetical protein BOTBODRAFT_177997 [Botryobasidium botryosum FD-172 SS1]|uniref:Uncharacterized protein n=1 Tax=Botryobasidium botryosum (strain FD-172 SS1) TaxID=930990 RepID=A0A067M7N6_BOTB1|nr:hypothetical protein BOTBODRAFT_177997 [Botryobasidium botryosum FD-172 SS1]
MFHAVSAFLSEGRTAGNETATQTGLNGEFTDVGVQLGRRVGLLREIAHSMHPFLASAKSDHISFPLSPPLGSTHSTHGESGSGVDRERAALIEWTRAIVRQLDERQLMDIAPVNRDAEGHAKLYSGADDDDEDNQMLDISVGLPPDGRFGAARMTVKYQTMDMASIVTTFKQNKGEESRFDFEARLIIAMTSLFSRLACAAYTRLQGDVASWHHLFLVKTAPGIPDPFGEETKLAYLLYSAYSCLSTR